MRRRQRRTHSSPIVGWLLAAVVLFGLVLRWFRASSQLVVALVAFSPLVIVPLIGLAVAVWRAWDRRLTLAFVGLATGYVASFVSIGAVVGCEPATSDDAFSIYSHNVWWQRGESDPIARSIDASDADILVLQEVWPSLLDELAAHPLLTGDYRYRASEPSDQDVNGLAVWSRFPISEAALEQLDDSTPVLRTTIEGPTGPFRLGAIHVTSPTSGAGTAAWDQQLDQLSRADTSSPALLVGDFNATDDHEQFRAILESGWTDAHGPKGCGLDATWPNARIWPTVLRLDHVLATEHFEVLAMDVGDNATSDHRPVIATLRLP